MLYFNRVEVSKNISINKTSFPWKCETSHCSYFLIYNLILNMC